MTADARQVHYSYTEYVSLESTSPIRHEYWKGEIYAMAGGSPDHAALAASLIGALQAQLVPPCRAFSSDLRVYVETTELTTYPDVTVVCGRSERAEKDPLAVTNPSFLAEITSPSTEDYDRGEKLRHYQTIRTVREVLIVSHREPRATLFHREDEGSWSVIELRAGETVELVVGATIAIDALYVNGLEDAP